MSKRNGLKVRYKDDDNKEKEMYVDAKDLANRALTRVIKAILLVVAIIIAVNIVLILVVNKLAG